MKPVYITNKKNNWHCQRQKTSRILLASDFVTWTARYILDLVFCFSYTDYKFICYLLLFVICLFVAVISLFTRNTSASCEISSNLVKTVLAFLIFLFTWSQFHFAFLYFLLNTNWWMLIDYQKQPSIGVLTKSCSENVQQMYRRTTV